MILFMIKKAFFDMWDNLLSIVLLNLGGTLLLGVGVYLPYILSFHPILPLFGIVIAAVLFILYIGTVSMIARDIADYRSPDFKNLFQYVKEVWKAALVFCFIIVIQLVIVTVVLPWYLKRGGLFGFLAMGILFWGSVMWWFASQYYFPIRSRLDTNIRKVLLKCFVMLFDNTFFTLVLGFGTLVLIILSSFTAFLLPGIGTILLWHQVGLKLRIYKYEHLEKYPGTRKRNIPWDNLLHDDRERVGHRTLRGFIFPWKE